MAFWFRRKPGARAAGQDAAPAAAGGDPPPPPTSAAAASAAPPSPPAAAAAASAPPPSPSPPSSSPPPPSTSSPSPSPGTLRTMNERMLAHAGAAAPATDALNPQIVQAVRMSNAETAAYAPSQIAIGPDMLIGQATGLVAQSAAAYFDGVTKLALASQGVLIKQMTQNLAEQNLPQAAEDALGVLATDVMMAAAAAVAAAAGAMEAESASFAIDRIDQSISKYSSLLAARKGGA